MNGDISRIPIQSLGAVVSLTDILPELPLPAPFQCGSGSTSLLCDPQLSADALCCLQAENETLTSSLSDALENASTDNIDFKEGFANDNIDLNSTPNLLTTVLLRNRDIFQNKRGFFGLPSFAPKPTHTSTSQGLAGQLGMGQDSWPSNRAVVVNSQDSKSGLTAMEDQSSSPNKKKKKRKKKKHKHRDGDVEDTSGTGGESNSTTPARYDESTPHMKYENNELSPAPTYGVVADTTKLSLKIFKRPVVDSSVQPSAVQNFPPTSDLHKKEKKKKRSRDKDRDHKSKHEHRSKGERAQIKLTTVTDTVLVNSPPLATTADSLLASSVISSASTVPPIPPSSSDCVPVEITPLNEAVSAARVSVPNFALSSQSTQGTAPTGDLPFMGGDNLFEHLNSANIPYRQPQSQSTSSLPSTPASAAGLGPLAVTSTAPIPTTIPTTSSLNLVQNHVSVTQSTLFDGILNDVDHSISMMDTSGIPDLMTAVSNCASMPPAASSANSLYNIMDYASHFLQSEILNSTSPGGSYQPMANMVDEQTVSRPELGIHQSPPSFNSSFMIASQLPDSVHPPLQVVTDPSVNMPAGMLNTSGYVSVADTSPSTAFVNSFDIAGLTSDVGAPHHVPMGLASYLAGPGQPENQNQPPCPANRRVPKRDSSLLPSNTSTPQSWWKRKSGPLRRRRRRKNEVEDLQSWTVNYPTAAVGGGKGANDRTDEKTWDDAIGSYSQALGERAKRRKRMARQIGNFDPAYVFEHDKDYPNGEESDAGEGGESSGVVDATRDPENAADGSQLSSCNTSRGLRTGVAQRSYAGMDDDDEGGAGSGAGVEGSRRRRKVDDDEPFEVRLKEPIEARIPHLMRKSSEATRKRRERVGFGGVSVGHSAQRRSRAGGDVSFGVETNCLKKFLQRLQSIMDSIEDTDVLQSIGAGGDAAEDGGTGQSANDDKTSFSAIEEKSIPPEAFIAPEDLTELCRDAAKLNATRIANQIPTDQLVKLLSLLLLNVRDGCSVIATLRLDEEADAQENKLWRELAMERVMRSVNAGLTALTLMTSNDMPREVYVEDVIERTVHTVRFQLFNCIYPEFDPAYRVENTAKENQSSIKSRRARERDIHKPRAVIQLYHKLVEIVSNLAKLVKMQHLTDSLVLSLSSIGVSVFFVENVSELQLAALELVTAIFAQYEPHRKLIMEEILASLARLPSSKRNLRSYRLNSEDSIQMLTALALLLVQSVIVLPTAKDAKPVELPHTNSAAAADQTEAANDPKTHDDEVLVISSYHNALRTAHTFLLVFLRKSTVKGEDDYRLIFENFVNDLLLAVNKPEWPAAEVMLSLLGSLLVQQFNNKSLDQSVRVASVDYLGTVASTLRRDAVSSHLKENDIDTVIRDLLEGGHSDDDEDGDDNEKDDAKEEEQNGMPSVDEVKEDDGTPVITADDEGEAHSQNASSTTKLTPKVEPSSEKNGFDSSSPNASETTATNSIEARSKKASPKKNKKLPKAAKNDDPIAQLDRVQALRDAILDYLAAEDSGPTAIYARRFYLAQWLNDCTKETERAQRAAIKDKEDVLVNGKSESQRFSTKLSASDQEVVLGLAERRRQHILYKIQESPDAWRQRRRFWGNSLIQPTIGRRGKQNFDADPDSLLFRGTLDYEDGCLVCRYLASLRPFSQSFDIYLSQICKLLSESSVAVRTKALRCLSAVVEVDPSVLARADIERAVHSRLLDTSTSVREAAVDLLGRFLGCKPELTAQYYPMLAERIRDKGVSVRKRVIRILRDICLEQPDFPRIAEICVKMIRRVNDEEGIKKLVNEVFQTMWFNPVREKETVKLLRKVMNITDVVAASKDTGYEWFEHFLRSLLKKEEGEKVKPVEKACKQIVDCLVQNIMRLEEISGQNNQRLVACLATLHLLTRIRPELMIQYTMVLQTYLRCNETADPHILHYVARILEVTVPLMEHPSETLVAQLEEDMVRLTLRQGKMVLESCVACLGSVVNRVSKNYSLARDCFTRFFNALQRFRTELAEDPERKIRPTIRPSILRALFTVGLLCKHFDANVFQSNSNVNIRDQVFDILMFFTEQVKSDIEMRKKALSGLGFLCTRHQELLCGQKLRDFYKELLQSEPKRHSNSGNDKSTPPDCQLELKCIVLENLLNFFLEEERRMLEADAKWKAEHHTESLKEMGDVASGMGSFVAQTYLKDTLETFFSPFVTVRLTALSVVSTILRQGLIHPVQTVPYLIAMQTDLDTNVRVKADAQLAEIDHKFPGFLSMRAIQGVNYSYRLQYVLFPELLDLVAQRSKLAGTSSQQMMSPDTSSTQKSTPSQPARRSTRHRAPNPPSDTTDANDTNISSGSLDETNRNTKQDGSDQLPTSSSDAENPFESIRGTRDPLSEIPSALNSILYSMLRGNRGQRRSLLSGLISLFDDSQPNTQHIQLSQLIYVADNLAHFPYQCQEEPLFVVHHIDLMVSMSGSGVLQSVREALFPELKLALEAALAAQAEADARHRAQMEAQLRAELEAHQAASAQATASGNQSAAEECAEKIQQTIQKLNTLTTTSSSLYGGIVGMNELRSAALVGRESVPQIDLGPLEEEEENPEAMLNRLKASPQTALPIMRDAIRASRACVLLLTLKQYLKDVYSITDAKIQRYSPSDSVKLWERPLTRRAGVRFHPGPCLAVAGNELRKLMSQFPENKPNKDAEGRETSYAWPPYAECVDNSSAEELYEGEMDSLIRDYLDFRKLILTIDPPDDEDLALDETNATNNPLAPAGDQINPIQTPVPTSKLRSARTLVPQSHNKSSDEENDSEDSNMGGGSRLMLAQSAPAKRRLRSSTRAVVGRSVKRKRKRRRRIAAPLSSSGDESDSLGESEASDAED